MSRLNLLATGALLVAALGLAACQPAAEAPTEEAMPAATEVVATMPTEAPTTAAPSTDALAGNWTLLSFGDKAAPTPVPEGVMVTATFADGAVSGNNGCNSYTGQYTLDGAMLTITPGATTLMACDEPQNQMSQDFMAALGAVTGYEATEGGLTLLYGEGQALVFSAAASGLAGTRWDVVNYNNGQQAVVGLAADSAITLEFGDGQVTGKACNTYNGPFTESAEQVTIGPLATTRMACPEAGVMEQETAYLAALQAATTWALEGGRLTLRDATGATQVIADPAAAQ